MVFLPWMTPHRKISEKFPAQGCRAVESPGSAFPGVPSRGSTAFLPGSGLAPAEGLNFPDTRGVVQKGQVSAYRIEEDLAQKGQVSAYRIEEDLAQKG